MHINAACIQTAILQRQDMWDQTGHNKKMEIQNKCQSIESAVKRVCSHKWNHSGLWLLNAEGHRITRGRYAHLFYFMPEQLRQRPFTHRLNHLHEAPLPSWSCTASHCWSLFIKHTGLLPTQMYCLSLLSYSKIPWSTADKGSRLNFNQHWYKPNQYSLNWNCGYFPFPTNSPTLLPIHQTTISFWV